MLQRLFMAVMALLVCAQGALAAPVVTLTAPANNTKYLPPAAITLAADAIDSTDTIAEVAFYRGTVLIGSATTAPYTFTWSDVPSGSYSITAKATNSLGVTKISSAIKLIVNTPPTVTLTAPNAGAAYVGLANIDLAADAGDPDGSIAKVAFYRGGTLIGTATAAPYTVTWSNVPPGTYAITARATDDLGGVTASTAAAVTVANPITVAVTTPAANTKYLPPASIDLTATAADATGSITQVDFYSGTTLIGTATAAPYTANWSNVATGKYSVTAKATDSQGITKTSSAIAVTVNTPPTVALTAPADKASYVGLATIELAADVADADGSITKVQFYRGGTLIGAATAAPYTFTWAHAPPGTYAITARATDNTGAVVSSNSATVTVTNPITIGLTAPATNSKYLPPAAIELAASATDATGSITQVDFYSGATLIGSATAAPYTFNWTNVPAGKYSLAAKATDSQGITKTSSAIAVTVNTPPTVALTAPADKASYVGLAMIELAADVADADGSITKVQFYRGGTLIGAATAAPYTFTWAHAPPGTYAITARATDDLGGVVTSSAVTVTVTNPITVNWTAPANNARFIPPANIELSADASDANGTVSQIEFYNGTTLIGTATAAPYTVSWSNVAAGKYTVTAKATDSQGVSKTSSALHLVVDTSPNVTLSAPAANARYAAPAAIALAADVSDPDGTIAKVQFYNGGTLLATLTGPPYTYTWTNVAKGNYTLKAKATDNLGVSTTSTGVAVQVVANVPPTVGITAPADQASYVAPASIMLTANAAPGISGGSIGQVAFYNGAALIGTASSAPYSVEWTKVAAGVYSVTAVATDALGAAGTSNPVNVTVINNAAPTVVVAANPDKASAPATIALSAAAADSDGSIAQVEFFNGTNLLATVTQAPYAYNWSNVGQGSYAVTAKATDNLGAQTVSAPVTVAISGPMGQVYYIHPDHLNSPRLITDASNNVVWQWENADPFGNNLPNSGTGFEFNLRFPGQYFDKETNLHYNYFRDYDPSTGRYIQSDPIGLDGGLNTYVYVEGDPLTMIDPEGLAGRKGERGRTGSPDGTPNPGKHWKEDPNRPGWGWQKDADGKKIYKRRPPYIPPPGGAIDIGLCLKIGVGALLMSVPGNAGQCEDPCKCGDICKK